MKKLFIISIFLFLIIFVTHGLRGQNGEPLRVGTAAPIFSLYDQYDNEFKLENSKGNVVILLIGDRFAREKLANWGKAVGKEFGNRVKIVFIISMPYMPPFLRGWIKAKFKGEDNADNKKNDSVLIDWGGKIFEMYESVEKTANLILIDRQGILTDIERGEIKPECKEKLFKSIELILDRQEHLPDQDR